MDNWRILHGQVMKNFVSFINANRKKFVIKGGTSLMLCYNLDRFSEDIDLDSVDKENIIPYVERFCKINSFRFNINKNTDTVKRCMIHYGGSKPLKVEVSYRTKLFKQEELAVINGILVYGIDKLMQLKCAAYLGRDKIRDLYDVTFIGLNYYNMLSYATISVLQAALSYKGIEQFDYLIHNQNDDLIDNNILATNFLRLWEILELQ